MLKILFAEDDKDLNLLITSHLKKKDFIVYSAYNGLDALKVLENENVDFILSDIMMPLCDGFELAKQVRYTNKDIPILLMSARDDKPSKKIGYQLGIDDYITKPFDLDELVLKINAIARRLKIETQKEIQIGNFKMNEDERTAFIDQEELSLTAREFDILFYLLSFPKKTFTRGQLMEKFWGFDTSATSRTVDVYMAKIREKIKNCNGFEIQTVHGLGYKAVLK